MRKDRYDQLIQESALVWHKLYQEEKQAKEELQSKYDLLVKQIKQQSNNNTSEEKITWDEERINVIGQNGNDGLHYIDFGAGKVAVQHKLKTSEKTGEFGELRDGFKEP